jgi:predicted nucleotidyltransferase
MDRDQVVKILAANRDILDAFNVKTLHLFGSVLRGEAGQESDVDILVEFEEDAKVGLFEFARLQERLAEILGQPVDLVTKDALHAYLRREILEEAIRAA